MPEENPNIKAIEVKSICFMCEHGQIMGIEQETRGVHPLSQKAGTFVNHKFMVVCRAHGAFVFGPNINVQGCTDFQQNEAGMKVLQAPKGDEVGDDANKTTVN